MTNKEFIDYMLVSKKLDINDCSLISIEDIKNCEVYLGDIILQLLNMDLDKISMLELVGTIAIEPIEPRYFLERLVELFRKHKKLVYDDLSDYMQGILNDVLYGLSEEKVNEKLLNYKILLDEKFIRLDNKVYKVKRDCLQFQDRNGRYAIKDVLYLTNILDSKDNFTASGILFKDKGYEIIYDVGNVSQLELFENILKYEKDFDFLLISSASWDRHSTLNFNLFRILEIMKNVQNNK